MKRWYHWVGSVVLPLMVVVMGVGLAAWKYDAIQEGQAASAKQPEPMETVTVAVAKEIEHRQSTTSIGTVLALRSITLKNELAGTVREVQPHAGANRRIRHATGGARCLRRRGRAESARGPSCSRQDGARSPTESEPRNGHHTGRSRSGAGRSGRRPGANRPHQGDHRPQDDSCPVSRAGRHCRRASRPISERRAPC